MNTASPQRLRVQDSDRDFLVGVARHVLGLSNVAATTATGLSKQGYDIKRVNTLIPCASVAVEVQGFVFKKVEGDQESPDNFGLFVRRRGEADHHAGL